MNEIIDGHLNWLLNNNEEIAKERMEICKQCPLYLETKIGPKCNPNKNIDGVKGCGCFLNAKTRNLESSCPVNKWKANALHID